MNEEKSFAEEMLQGMEAMAPVFDFADGMRANLERRGWSPTMAEAIAGQWLAHVITRE